MWISGFAYIWLRAEGLIPPAWDSLFFPIFVLWFAVNFIYGLLALTSAYRDARKSQNPDGDVAALIDGEIDIAEYGQRSAPRGTGSGHSDE